MHFRLTEQAPLAKRTANAHDVGVSNAGVAVTSAARTHTQGEAEAGLLPLVAGMLIFVPIVVVGNEVATMFRYPELGAAVLFPPYAALAAVLVASPRRHWWAYIVVAAVAHGIASLPHWPLTWVLLADAANITRALVAAITLRWLFDGVPRLNSVLAVTKFFACAVVLAPAVGATIGAANLVLHGASPTYWRPWSLWYVSNALTALTMLPGLLAIATEYRTWQHTRVARHRVIEAIVLVAALAVMCAGAFLRPSETPGDLTWLLYAPLPLLMWAALRFGDGGASLALTAVAGVAIWSADHGTGPFTSAFPDDRVLSLQLFILLTAIPVLYLAAMGSARRGAVELYRALLASLQDQVAVLDARGVVLEVNASWQLFVADDHRGPLDHVGAGDDFLAACRTAIESQRASGTLNDDFIATRAHAAAQRVLSGASRRVELEYDQLEANREWYTMRIEALEHSDGGVVVTRANVSARHRAQSEIAEQRSELWHLSRVAVLGQLSGAFAHELRQPLSTILANAEAARHLLRNPRPDIGELQQIVQDIATSDRRAVDVIDSLRSLLKRGETRMQPVATAALIGEVLALANAELAPRRVTLIADIAPHLPPLLADRVQVQQVLLNLILNASEAMRATGPDERTIRFTAEASGTSVAFAIEDNGTGIPSVLLHRIFDSFVTTKHDGLGLGLSIARAIVDAHGGRLWAENNPTGGATLHCVLRSAPQDAIAPPLYSPITHDDARLNIE